MTWIYRRLFCWWGFHRWQPGPATRSIVCAACHYEMTRDDV